MQALTAMPARFSAGSTLTYTRTLSDLPSTTSAWKLAVYLVGPARVAKTGIALVNGVFTVLFTPTDTATLAAGAYSWLERVIEDSPGTRVLDLALGSVAITPNLAPDTLTTLLTWEAQVLVALQARLLGRTTTDQESISIDGTAIMRIPVEKLDELITKYKRIVELQNNPNAAFGSVEIHFGAPSLPTIPGYPLRPTGGNW